MALLCPPKCINLQNMYYLLIQQNRKFSIWTYLLFLQDALCSLYFVSSRDIQLTPGSDGQTDGFLSLTRGKKIGDRSYYTYIKSHFLRFEMLFLFVSIYPNKLRVKWFWPWEGHKLWLGWKVWCKYHFFVSSKDRANCFKNEWTHK